MTPFRAFQVSIAAMILIAHVWIVQALTATPAGSSSGVSGGGVEVAVAQDLDNDDNDAADNGDNVDGDNEDNEVGDNEDNADGDNEDNEDIDDEDIDNVTFEELPTVLPIGLPTVLPPGVAPTTITGPICSTPGEETIFTSPNERVIVRVFPPTQPSIRVELRPVFDLLTLPLVPGPLVDLLIYDVVAGVCSEGGALLTPIRSLPAEVNLSFRYLDADVFGLDESNLVIAHLDFQTLQWTPVPKQAQDVANNVIAATISETGFYAVFQRP